MAVPSCVALLAATLALGACSTEGEPPVPPACLEGPATVERALADAPGAVTLDGTPLSACVAQARTESELQNVGAILTRVAEDLERRAEDGDERAALELGYLVAAARRGAGDNVGVQEELARRLERSTAFPADPPPDVAAALERGLRAGAARG